MRIAIDARPIGHIRRHGIFNYTEKLISELVNLDSENEYFLLFQSLKRKASSMPGPQKNNVYKKVLRLPNRDVLLNDFLLSKIAIPSFLARYKCDIFHSTFDTIDLHSRKVNYILTIHDLKSFIIKEDPWKQNLKKYKRALSNANIIIAVSESTKKDIMECYPISPEKIKVIYEGVDKIYRKIDNQNTLNSIRDRYGLRKNFFFAMGQIPRKNTERIIRAFSKFKYKTEFDLVVGGLGSNGPWHAKYQELTDSLNIAENVKFIGYITTNEDLLYLYNRADCFVFPSLYEGFGLPVLEAMACGTPVITSNISSLPEVGGDAALYVNPYGEEEITRAMEKIVEDSDFKNDLIQKGFNQVQKFSWEKMAGETLNVYKSFSP